MIVDSVDGFWVPNIEHSWEIVTDIYTQDYYQTYQRPRLMEEEYVLDIGASFGPFTRLWHERNPAAKIAVVEVDPDMAAALRTNVGSYAEVFESACIYRDDNQCLAAQKLTVEEIMRRLGWPRIDFLKVSCEGSECDILEHCDLSKIFTIFCETYDPDRWRKLMQERFSCWDIGHMRRNSNREVWHLVNQVFNPVLLLPNPTIVCSSYLERPRTRSGRVVLIATGPSGDAAADNLGDLPICVAGEGHLLVPPDRKIDYLCCTEIAGLSQTRPMWDRMEYVFLTVPMAGASCGFRMWPEQVNGLPLEKVITFPFDPLTITDQQTIDAVRGDDIAHCSPVAAAMHLLTLEGFREIWVFGCDGGRGFASKLQRRIPLWSDYTGQRRRNELVASLLNDRYGVVVKFWPDRFAESVNV